MIPTILVALILWSLFGYVWAVSNRIWASRILDYTKKTIFIGGPLWWVIYFAAYLNYYGYSIKRFLPRPKLKED